MFELIAKRAAAQCAASERRERAEERKRLREFIKTQTQRRGPRVVRRSAGRGRAGRVLGSTPTTIMKIHRGGLAADAYAARKGELLDTNMPTDSKARARCWQVDQARFPRVSSGLFQHVTFSARRGLRLDDNQWRSYVSQFFRSIGAESCKYALWRHSDTEFDHVHLVLSTVRADGGRVKLANNFWTWRVAARESESEIGLTPPEPAPGDFHYRQHQASRPASDRAVAAERRARRQGKPSSWVRPELVREALARSTSPAQLQRELAARNIELQLLRNNKGLPTGLLLRARGSDAWLAGSSVARWCSLPRVTAALHANRVEKTGQSSQFAPYNTSPPRPRSTLSQRSRERG